MAPEDELRVTFDERVPQGSRRSLAWLVRRCHAIGLPIRTLRGRSPSGAPLSVSFASEGDSGVHVAFLVDTV